MIMSISGVTSEKKREQAFSLESTYIYSSFMDSVRLSEFDWKNKLKHYSDWIIVRKKYCSDWKKEAKQTELRQANGTIMLKKEMVGKFPANNKW